MTQDTIGRYVRRFLQLQGSQQPASSAPARVVPQLAQMPMAGGSGHTA